MADSPYQVYKPSPVIQGLNTFVNQSRANNQRSADMRTQKIQLDDKAKQDLIGKFTSDIEAAKDVLSKTTDEKQRDAVLKALEAMRSVYTGSMAQQFGLDGNFSRQIDFVSQTPGPQVKAAAGSSSNAGGGTLDESGEYIPRGGTSIERRNDMAAYLAQKEADGKPLTVREQTLKDALGGQTNKATEKNMVNEAEFKANYSKAKGFLNSYKMQTDDLSNQIDKALAYMPEDGQDVEGKWGTGWSAYLSAFPSKARELQNAIDSIKSSVIIETLQRIRQESPTGAAFGNVSNYEDAILGAIKGPLDAKQPKQLFETLKRIKDNLPQAIKNREDAFNHDYGRFSGTQQQDIGIQPVTRESLSPNVFDAGNPVPATPPPAPMPVAPMAVKRRKYNKATGQLE